MDPSVDVTNAANVISYVPAPPDVSAANEYGNGVMSIASTGEQFIALHSVDGSVASALSHTE